LYRCLSWVCCSSLVCTYPQCRVGWAAFTVLRVYCSVLLTTALFPSFEFSPKAYVLAHCLLCIAGSYLVIINWFVSYFSLMAGLTAVDRQ